ncbi:unnamed protein product [Sphenostylis stenocarpa]|uniref:Uncharacterized protein n=1 Tax=Sphenostylis stenocarpa TaxID=92480 RepID=A0AA86SXC4_9FABA|nr:unnamed protein product [Sphenostylis stenocarpa]
MAPMPSYVAPQLDINGPIVAKPKQKQPHLGLISVPCICLYKAPLFNFQTHPTSSTSLIDYLYFSLLNHKPFLCNMSSSEGVFELGMEFSEADNVLLMSLMEETQEEEYYGDERLVSMIQSLEAEISDTEMGQIYEMGHVDDQYCSTSDTDPDNWVDMELISSLPFDEMNAWMPCVDEMMEHAAMEDEAANDINDFQFCYEAFLEQQYREISYLAQGPSDVVF